MTYDELQIRMETSAALKLLQSHHATMIIAFLYRQFKAKQKMTIRQRILTDRFTD